MPTLSAVLLFLAAYVLGSIPFGYLVARARGVDIFKAGSGNIGATNVGRVLGWRLGVLVFMLDFAKGALPAAAGLALGGSELGAPLGESLGVGAGLAALLGHLFPVFLRFHGGKGVATGAGVVVVLLPGPALGAVLAWLTFLCATRYMSLASLLAAVVLCGVRLTFTADAWSGEHLALTLFCFVAAVLVFVRHRSNLARLIQGNENRLQESTGMIVLTRTLHVLALGLWFGSNVFFSLVAAPLIFASFGGLVDLPAHQRPGFLASSMRAEDGNQLAGLAVGPIFSWFFAIQGICGALGLGTAWAWVSGSERRKIDTVRFWLLAAALLTVVGGWPIAEKVGRLRMERYSADPKVAAVARADFGSWHGYSLLLNFATLGLAGVGLALAGQMPSARPGQQITN
jgi:acyl-phosphate glycerol 3-phosphate acyltransferase